MTGPKQLISGVATVAELLQQASAALAQLTAQAAKAKPPSLDEDAEGLQDAVAALSQATASLTAAAGALQPPPGSAMSLLQPYTRLQPKPPPVREAPRQRHLSDLEELEPPSAGSTQEFCTGHRLEPFVGEMLDLLTLEQRQAVMDPPIVNSDSARNLSGIFVSRIKQVVPLDRRLEIFVEINNLSERVLDRLGTLSPEDLEAVMDSGMKIQKAANPSAIAMSRITAALADSRHRQSRPGHAIGAASASGQRQRSIAVRSPNQRQPPPPSRNIVQHHPRERQRHSQRSRSPRPRPRKDEVQDFVESLGLEWWCGEVLRKLSLWQRKQIMDDTTILRGVRNPNGVIMSKVRSVADIGELLVIFIDLNQLDEEVQEELWGLTPEQQASVVNPGIFMQNVRNPSGAVRIRINNVLAGRDAFGNPFMG